MKFRTSSFLLLGIAPSAFTHFAYSNTVLQPHFENEVVIQPVQPEIEKPVVGESSSSITQPESVDGEPDAEVSTETDTQVPTGQPIHLTTEALLADPDLTEQLINSSLIRKNWAFLNKLLPVYAKIKGHDPVLLSYARGALYRHQGQHSKAIAEYRSILAHDPSLVYVRFDLAAMLFENKQYEAAEDQFRKVKSADLPEQLNLSVENYLEAIQKKTAWRFNAGINYQYNDNVNNASEMRDVQIGSLVFKKDQDSLPKSANGVGYSLGIGKDINIQDQHYLTLNASVHGISYWNNQDFSERTVHLDAGYKYQNFQSWFSVAPFVEQNWLGENRYGFNHGVNIEYGRWLNNKNQLIGAYSFVKKDYEQENMDRYEGELHRVALTGAHFYSPTLIFIGGLDAQWDILNGKDESSDKYGVRAGVIKEWSNGISGRMNLRYARRTFHEAHFFMSKVRKDNEYQVDLSLWHRKIHWQGITPKINYRYLKIDSNIPEFYTRDSQQWFLSFEKTF